MLAIIANRTVIFTTFHLFSIPEVSLYAGLIFVNVHGIYESLSDSILFFLI